MKRGRSSVGPERWPVTSEVAGSSPVAPAKGNMKYKRRFSGKQVEGIWYNSYIEIKVIKCYNNECPIIFELNFKNITFELSIWKFSCFCITACKLKDGYFTRIDAGNSAFSIDYRKG